MWRSMDLEIFTLRTLPTDACVGSQPLAQPSCKKPPRAKCTGAPEHSTSILHWLAALELNVAPAERTTITCWCSTLSTLSPAQAELRSRAATARSPAP